jgi:hypothetical protein
MDHDTACPIAQEIKEKGYPATLLQNDDGTYRIEVELAFDWLTVNQPSDYHQHWLSRQDSRSRA